MHDSVCGTDSHDEFQCAVVECGCGVRLINVLKINILWLCHRFSWELLASTILITNQIGSM